MTVTRAALGLPDSDAPRRDPAALAGITVHVTTGRTLGAQQSDGRDDILRWVRNLWAFHTAEPLGAHGDLPPVTPWQGARGWADIGYHALLHVPTRTIIDGRPHDRQGAHARGTANRTRLGVAVLGTVDQLDDDQERWIGAALRKLAARVGLDPADALVDGHRDHGSTDCPGDVLYDRLEPIAANMREDTMDRDDIAARLDRIERHVSEQTRADVQTMRNRVGLPPDPDSDALWVDWVAEGGRTLADAAEALAEKANDRE